MSGSQVVKRTLPLIIALLLIIGIAVSCTIFNKDKVIPSITSADEIYFEVEDDGRTFSMTNKEIYTHLKNNYGLSMLVEMIDIDLLKSGDTDYYNAVTEEEIKEAISDEMFPSGKDDLDDDEIEAAEEKFFEDMLTNRGLRTEDDINKYYRLTLAKRKYAEAQLIKEIEEADKLAKEEDKDPYFTEKEYETQYKADYQNGYWAMIVPFQSEEEGKMLLKQLGITVHERDTSVSGDFTKWVKTIDGEEVALTTKEVVEAFIAMYNAVYSYKVEGYPENSLTLFDGVHYEIDEDGRYKFNTKVASEDEDQRLNEFYYSFERITEYNSSIQNYMKVSMKNYVNYDNDEITSGQNFYTPTLRSYVNNTLFVYILKIDEEIAPDLDDVRDDVYQTLFEKQLTENYINNKIIELREKQKFEIYDEILEEDYLDSILSSNIEHKKTKASSKGLVAKVGDIEYSADKFFEFMDGRFGMSIALNRINYFRLLNNPEMNKVYDYYNTDLKEKDRILDADKWQIVKNSVRGVRDSFLGNAFANYGFPYTYGWHNFIQDYFGVYDENELKFYFLYREVVTDFTDDLASIEDLEEDSELWKNYQEKMQEIADEFFSVTGIHILISVNDDAGSPTEPENWTPYQRELAEELFEEIWKYYNTELGSSAEKLEAIATMYKEAPRFLAGIGQNVLDQPEGFDYVVETDDYKFEFSKYKSAGLSVVYQDLGQFGAGTMVEKFEAAVREMWKQNPTANSPTPYTDLETGEPKAIITEFGYHGYVNLSSTDITKWYYSSDEDKTEPWVLPTLQMVKTYLIDSESTHLLDDEEEATEEEFTTAMETAISTYFTPVYDEVSGTYNVTIKLYEEFKNLDFTFNSLNYTEAQFNEFVQGRIKSYQSNLKYFTVEEE